jgi:hypothetical protein
MADHRFPRRLISKRSYFGGWLEVGVFECRCGNEERFIRVRLPSYGMMYSINVDEYRWGQRVLMYRGHAGFSIWPYFKPEALHG